MKALIRNKGETIVETAQIDGIDWNTGAPLTNPTWAGGPYNLVQNYVPPKDDEPTRCEEVIVSDPEPIVQDEEVVEDDDYVVIGGVRYSKNELRSLIE